MVTVRAQARPRIVATFSLVGDVVRVVGGDRIERATLVGPDGDTERYEPVPSDAQAIASASLIFENGLGSEPWLDRLYAASRSSARRVQTSAGIEFLRDDESGEFDPHVWHDPSLLVMDGDKVRDGL